MKILRSQYMQLRNRALAAADNEFTNPTEYGGKKNIDDRTGSHIKHDEIKTKAISITHRRQTIDCTRNGSSSISSMFTNIQIHIDNIERPLKKLNVIVEFTNMSSLWLTKLYKTYENDLWRRSERFLGNTNKRTRWYYHCNLCTTIYRKFNSLKGHLNLHLKYFPYVCKMCGLKYTNRQAATRHLRNYHALEREIWNEYLVS